MSELFSTAEAVALQAQIFDQIRPSGARLFLLKRAGQTQRFTLVAEISAGWFVTFDKEFRDEMKVMIATDASDFPDKQAQSSFLAYGVGTTGTEISVFSFDSKDSHPPHATSPNWKIFAKREAQERFTIP